MIRVRSDTAISAEVIGELDQAAVDDLVEAYNAREGPDRTEDLDGAIRFANVIQQLAGKTAAAEWLHRQAALIRNEIAE